MIKLKKNDIMKKRKIGIDLLIESFNTYFVSLNSEERLLNPEIYHEKLISCVDSLSEIFEEFLSFGKFKDNWDYNYFNDFLNGPELIIKSLKTNCTYGLGINNEGLFLSMHLNNAENLRYMDDLFWKNLLNLSDFDGFIYEEYEFIRDERRKEFPELFKTNKSMIFRILRKYIFDSTENHSQYLPGSVGEFKMSAKFSDPLPSSIQKFSKAFKIMYKLNYSLWKIKDLKDKKDPL